MGTVYAKSPEMRNVARDEMQPLDEISARVDKVHFDGIKRTKEDVIMHVVRDLLKAQTVQEVYLKAHGVRYQLETLQAFKSIDFVVDTSRGPDATPGGLEVTFNVEENSRISGGVHGSRENNSNSFMLSLLLPNMFGRGEALSVECKPGWKSAGLKVASTKPFLHWTKPRLNQCVFGSTTECLYRGIQEKVKGFGVDFLFESSPQVQHAIQWEGVRRNLRCLSPTPPFEIRAEAGNSVKSSVKYVLCMDKRDDPCLPLRGSYFRLHEEYAGLGGNTNFLKHEIQYQVNKSIFGDLVVQATFMGGLVQAFGADKSIKTTDRFFLGGPLTLRGFEANSVGPQAQDCFLGADAYWAGGLHVYAPLPFRPLAQYLEKVCRAHVFLNAGSIGNFAPTDDYRHNAMVLLSRLRLSGGMGLVFSLGGKLRLELNYCVPFVRQPGDRAREGFQFGIGVTFT